MTQKCDAVILVERLTKDYGRNKGVFDVGFEVKEGEIFGFLGPNGAGKTTTIRHLMGFIRPDEGSVRIWGKDCFLERADIQSKLGYLPGEIAFMDGMDGREFIRFIAKMKGMDTMERARELMDYFELDPRGKIRRMSKGMKQKIGIVCAFMTNPSLLILDEPTSGLDPLMQNRFTTLLLEEKKRGTTVFISSHIFEEIEKTCDRTAFIKDGKIAAIESMDEIRKKRSKVFEIQFAFARQAEAYVSSVRAGGGKARLLSAGGVYPWAESTVSGDMDPFIKSLGQYQIRDLRVKEQTLEERFLHLYGGSSNDK
ncbi:MAG: ABC transporter ATP-binding protein [Clostridiales bacterium]|nr:ABC transporter ATP-binding protein [Clostridiales bacterium]